LKEFAKWDSAAAAIAELDKLIDGKVPPMLAELLDQLKDEKKVSLAVADKNLGTALQKLPGLSITPVAAGPGTPAGELYRSIREHLASLVPGTDEDTFNTMALGLSHSLSRHKLKFSPDKLDVMIVQAVSLLDDLDKELNVYAMRCKEWYGWHFPELGKILNDNLAYAKVVLTVGMRENIDKADLGELLPEEIEAAVKSAAAVSMGTEISPEDLKNIVQLAEQVVTYTEYRAQLSGYLESRMKAIAPNLTALVGTLVGARLIAHTGSLMNLAKSAGSTVQILGAEKSLFRALKTKHATPKYGLIYHASLVGQATGKNKGKMARKLASKAALGIRIDALDDSGNADKDEDEMHVKAVEWRAGLENQLRKLEGRPLGPRTAEIAPQGPGKWDIKEARKYNRNADGLDSNEPAAAEESASVPAVTDDKKSKREKKDKAKRAKALIEDAESADVEMDDGEKKSKDKKSKEAKKEKKDKKKAKAPTSEEDEDVEMADETNGANGAAGKSWLRASQHTHMLIPSTATTQSSEPDFEKLASLAGISVSKFKRKYERGDIELDSTGNPVVHSKKEMRKIRKAEEKAASDSNDATSKRKRDDDGEKPKKKKKKNHAADV
jgi:nucleolar protein 58